MHPLAEVGIGVLVAIRIGGSKLVMDVLGDRKRGQRQKQRNQAECEAAREPIRWERGAHGIRIEYHKATKAVKMAE